MKSHPNASTPNSLGKVSSLWTRTLLFPKKKICLQFRSTDFPWGSPGRADSLSLLRVSPSTSDIRHLLRRGYRSRVESRVASVWAPLKIALTANIWALLVWSRCLIAWLPYMAFLFVFWISAVWICVWWCSAGRLWSLFLVWIIWMSLVTLISSESYQLLRRVW
jgi:hypothetical protein